MRTSRVSVSRDRDVSPKTLTPQRKHRKLLKDGSSEVWPEEIERMFVQGLREYWESPWATYSRGRSRWRNQFLVDYLQRVGIDRSKKQVASHIQVLRNMWKGEAEYHLVAGGEELFFDTGLHAPVKAEDLPDSHLLASMVFDDHSPASDRSGVSVSRTSRSTVPCASPAMGSKMEPAMSPYPNSRMHTADDGCRRVRSMSTSEIACTEPRRLSPLASSLWTPDMSVRPTASQSCPHVPYTATRADLDFNRDYQRLNQPMLTADPTFPDLLLSDSPRVFNSSSLFSSIVPGLRPPILTDLSLWAEGMQPATVPVDALSSRTQPADLNASVVALRVKLHLPPIEAPYSPALHGFQGSITCDAPCASSIRCSTAVFVRNQCVSRESSYCSVIATDSTGPEVLDHITLLLPDSQLSCSRWLDPNMQACIVQKIVVDEHVIAVIYYDLDRGQCENLPSVELTGFQKYTGHADDTQVPTTNAFIPSYTYTPGHCIPRTVHATPTSLSHALTPPITNSPLRPIHESPYMMCS
ncbi:uncharacterized protein EDB91DRAFT_1094624 [Suillus paluster]|uniref:uncharacterized protein n=1 Tax=Suillus paluster TaxID=48578 RepID=UPI001B875B9A|nr:uncharacterized protein EDB91DRAFT_1094624 [Suillus paluster]KAG1756822.1 hypothetical protein EDB91DRAFT_1094624 [Suillus paluster]